MMKVIKSYCQKYCSLSFAKKIALWGLIPLFATAIISAIGLKEEASFSDLVIKSKNKTSVEVSKVEPVSWLGDREKFLTVYFKNTSAHDALDFSVYLVGESGEIEFSPSNFQESFSGGFALSAGQEIGIPVAPVSELGGILKEESVSGRIIGYGLADRISEQKEKELIDKYYKDGKGYYAVGYHPLAVKYKYKTIFGDQVETMRLFFLYIDETHSA